MKHFFEGFVCSNLCVINSPNKIDPKKPTERTYPFNTAQVLKHFASLVSFVPVSTPVPTGFTPPASGCSYSCCHGCSVAMEAHLGTLEGKLEENSDLRQLRKATHDICRVWLGGVWHAEKDTGSGLRRPGIRS